MFLVGVGGGVPHYTNWNQHVRLGDVVVSHVGPDRKYEFLRVFLLTVFIY